MSASAVRAIGYVAAALLVGLLVGCAQSDGASCASDAECASGQICQSERCATLCETNDDCSVGRRCQSGVCAVPASCRSTDDCRADEICENRVCELQTPECAADRDCPPGQQCNNGACAPTGVIDVECITRADCEAGESCLDNVCVPLVDAGAMDAGTDGDADAQPDSEPVDTSPADTGTPDVPEPGDSSMPSDGASGDAQPADTAVDAADAPDAPECTTLFDCAENEVCISGTCVLEEPPDLCEGRDDGVTGEICTGAADCCNGLCLGNPLSGVGSCTQDCATFADCNPLGSPFDLFCYDTGPSGRLCAQSDYLDTCGSANDCLGGRCLVSNSRRGCTWDCRSSADCPGGEVCGLVAFGTGGGGVTELQVCTPIGGACLTSNDCLSGTCLVDDADPRLNYCSTFCQAADPASCPSGYVCSNEPGAFVCVRR